MKIIKDFLRILLFFPSITFNLLKAEVFPWAIIYSFLSSCNTDFFKIKINRALPLLILLFLSTIFSLYYSAYYDIDNDSIRSLFAYLNPLLLFISLYSSSYLELGKIKRLFVVILWFFIFLGLFQVMGLLNFLEPIFNSILTRGNTETFGLGRGVSLLSSEPSRAAYEFIFVYITWYYISKDKSTFVKFYPLMDLVVLFFLTFVIRSSLGLVTFFIYLSLKYQWKLIIPSIFLFAFSISIIQNSSSRAIQILYDVIESSSFNDIFLLILNQSGFRLVSLIAAFKFAISHPLGGGVGLWQSSSVIALNETGYDSTKIAYFVENSGGAFSAVRPDSFMASLALDLGLLGVFLALFMLMPIIKSLKDFKNGLFPIVGVFLFILFFSGAVGNPLPWLCMLIAFRYYQINKKSIINPII